MHSIKWEGANSSHTRHWKCYLITMRWAVMITIWMSEYDSIAALKENYSSFLSDQIIEGDPDDVEGILEGTKDNDIISAIQDVTEIFEVVSNDYLNGINRTSHLVREF